MDQDTVVAMPREDFEELLTSAAEKGARRALAEVGLDGVDAASDIRDLRSLMAAIRASRSAACQVITKILTTAVIAGILAVVGIKTKFLGMLN